MAEELQQAAEEPGEQEEQEEADRQLARTLQFQADDIGVGEGGEGIGEEEQKGEPSNRQAAQEGVAGTRGLPGQSQRRHQR